MTSFVKEKFKESFINIQFIAIFLGTIASIILYFFFTSEILLSIFLLGLFLTILFVVGFVKNIKSQKHTDSVRNGERKFESCFVDKNVFVNECRNGLLRSLIKIGDGVYEVETQLDDINSTNYDKFVCYFNDQEIVGVDAFLNYKFDGVHSLNDLNVIEFLEYDGGDPKKYFGNSNINQ